MKNYMRAVCLLFGLLMVCTCAGCSGEGKGVPENTVLYDIGYRYDDLSEISHSVKHKISHNVDKASHIDSVSVELAAESEYGTELDRVVLRYQYDKSSDTWTLIDELDTRSLYDWSCELILNEEEFLGEWITDDEMFYLTIHEISRYEAEVSYRVLHGNSGEWEEENRIKVTLRDSVDQDNRNVCLYIGKDYGGCAHTYFDIQGVHNAVRGWNMTKTK